MAEKAPRKKADLKVVEKSLAKNPGLPPVLNGSKNQYMPFAVSDSGDVLAFYAIIDIGRITARSDVVIGFTSIIPHVDAGSLYPEEPKAHFGDRGLGRLECGDKKYNSRKLDKRSFRVFDFRADPQTMAKAVADLKLIPRLAEWIVRQAELGGYKLFVPDSEVELMLSGIGVAPGAVFPDGPISDLFNEPKVSKPSKPAGDFGDGEDDED